MNTNKKHTVFKYSINKSSFIAFAHSQPHMQMQKEGANMFVVTLSELIT